MKRIVILIVLFAHCTSGSDENKRNKDAFDETGQLSFPAFTSTSLAFNGNIASVITEIQGTALNSSSDVAAPSCGTTCSTVEGIVTMPSNYAFGMANATAAEATTGCTAPDSPASNYNLIDKVFTRSFILQDGNAAILVAYGLEPPLQDTSQISSMKYIGNARNGSMAVFGDRLRLTVKRVHYYGVTAPTAIPVITDFSNPVVVSTRNSAPYSNQTAAFVRGTDLYRMRRVEGYVTAAPANESCPSGKVREFQFNYQLGYVGTICIGAASAADAQACSGAKIPIKFQLSYNLGAGTLSGFDTDKSFSYNLAKDAHVRLTGPVFPPQFNQNDGNLLLMLGQRVQAETIK